MRARVVTVVIAVSTAIAGCGSATPATPSSGTTGVLATTPVVHQALSGAALAFDRSRGAVLAFGGVTASGGNIAPSAATWRWFGDRWETADVAGGPPGRTDALFAFDPALHGLVLLGGHAETQTAPTCPPPAAAGEVGCASAGSPVRNLSDAWLLSASGWRQLNTAGAPGVGWAAATDPSRHALLVVGSTLSPPQGHDGTWQHTGTGWAALNVTTPDYGASLGFDPISHQLLAFAGQRPHNPPPGSLAATEPGYAHTWALTDAGWQQLQPPTVPTFAPGVLTAGPDGAQLLLITALGQTWAWTGSNWQRYPTENSPPGSAVVGLAAATDTTHHVIVAVFTTDRGDTTWTLAGHYWTRYNPTP